MEFAVSGNALKTFARCLACLSRIGNELVIQASSHQLAFHTLNSSRSAYQSITFMPNFFDVYTVSGAQVQCSVLLKAVCAVLRTPTASIDNLTVQLPNSDAPKVQWTLKCYNGMKKAYWITCNVEPDIQHLSLDRRRFPSNFVVRPRDLNRLLSNFQSSLQEITVIATEPTSLPSDAASEIGGKAVELRSYIDPTKDNDSTLHTQLWIDPTEEFVQYTHSGDPVDVTFGVKELKVRPILMAPKFGLDDGSGSNFDATLVLATMLVSQLQLANSSEHQQAAASIPGQNGNRTESQAQKERRRMNVSEHPSDHTRVWSELSGSAVRSGSGAERQVNGRRNMNGSAQRVIQKTSTMHISKNTSARENGSEAPTSPQGHVPFSLVYGNPSSRAKSKPWLTAPSP
ncbi:cell cycle checkpoint control protein family [Citrus sinensis]|uniref:Cell cycle checkpoint control protein family n=1 Tax=Citrus sinensis TaxID=2711 RepID=A0ACB8KLM5_CITSI|nr:cell cycle checkpoint control protein family [Citrus sinensis]